MAAMIEDLVKYKLERLCPPDSQKWSPATLDLILIKMEDCTPQDLDLHELYCYVYLVKTALEFLAVHPNEEMRDSLKKRVERDAEDFWNRVRRDSMKFQHMGFVSAIEFIKTVEYCLKLVGSPPDAWWTPR